MRVMVLIKSDKQTEAGILPDEKLLAGMMKFNEELVKAGVMLTGEGLHPSSKGVQVKFSASGKRTVIDGPFTEAKELIAGYWLWQVKSMEEAVEWVKRMGQILEDEGVPIPPQDAEIEIRQVIEPPELGEGFTPELREREARIRAQASAKANQ